MWQWATHKIYYHFIWKEESPQGSTGKKEGQLHLTASIQMKLWVTITWVHHASSPLFFHTHTHTHTDYERGRNASTERTSFMWRRASRKGSNRNSSVSRISFVQVPMGIAFSRWLWSENKKQNSHAKDKKKVEKWRVKVKKKTDNMSQSGTMWVSEWERKKERKKEREREREQLVLSNQDGGSRPPENCRWWAHERDRVARALNPWQKRARLPCTTVSCSKVMGGRSRRNQEH